MDGCCIEVVVCIPVSLNLSIIGIIPSLLIIYYGITPMLKASVYQDHQIDPRSVCLATSSNLSSHSIISHDHSHLIIALSHYASSGIRTFSLILHGG